MKTHKLFTKKEYNSTLEDIMFCISFIAYGDEHINEFNIVAKSLLKINPFLKIIVGTNCPDQIINGIYKIIYIDEPFNYNLKRLIIEKALEEFDTIIFLDTDVFILDDVDFSVLENITDGIHGVQLDRMIRLRKNRSLEWIKPYLEELKKIYDGELRLINEGIFIVKLTDLKKKKKFIDYWYNIDIKTRPYQQLAYNLPGAMEGILIYIAAKKSEIEIKIAEEELIPLYSHIHHFGKRNRKMEKTII